MTLKHLVLAVYAIAVMLVSIIGWYALDFSQAVSALLPMPGSVTATLAVLWGASLVLLSILVAILLRHFVRPLEQLRQLALRIASGDYSARLVASANTEIGDLQLAFNRMAKELAARAQAEEHRRRAEERYRLVFDHANIGISQATLDGRLVAVNPALARLLGYAPDDLLGRTWQDITHPDDRERQMQEHRAFLAGELPRYQMEKRYVRQDGSEVWVDVTVALSPGDRESEGCIVVTAADITARRQAQAEQERYASSLAIFRESMNQSNDMLMVVDNASGRLLDVNDTACRLLGYSRDELLALKVSDIAVGFDAGMMAQRAADARAAHGLVFNSVDRRKDGSALPVEVSLRVVDIGGRSLGIAVVRDITERISREEQLRLLLEATEEGIYTVDPGGIVTLCNGAATRLLGYDSASEIIGRNSHALSHHTRADGTPYPEAECPLRHAFERRQVSRVDGDVFWRKDGSPFPVEYAIYPIVRMDTVIGALVSFSDVTHKQHAEAALRHSQKMEALGSLTSGIAHEINNMLMPILSLAGMTAKELPEDSRARLRLDKISDAAARARDLISRLGAFARMDEVSAARNRADVGEAVGHALALVRATLPPAIEVVESLGDGDTVAMINASAIQTAVLNLLSNAVDALHGQGGLLRVDVRRVRVDEAMRARVPALTRPAYVCVTVADSGRGMDEDTVKRMFDPFFTTKDVGAGTGLGLAVVHGIVEAHDGATAVTSQPGKGTIVEVFLPA